MYNQSVCRDGRFPVRGVQHPSGGKSAGRAIITNTFLGLWSVGVNRSSFFTTTIIILPLVRPFVGFIPRSACVYRDGQEHSSTVVARNYYSTCDDGFTHRTTKRVKRVCWILHRLTVFPSESRTPIEFTIAGHSNNYNAAIITARLVIQLFIKSTVGQKKKKNRIWYFTNKTCLNSTVKN